MSEVDFDRGEAGGAAAEATGEIPEVCEVPARVDRETGDPSQQPAYEPLQAPASAWLGVLIRMGLASAPSTRRRPRPRARSALIDPRRKIFRPRRLAPSPPCRIEVSLNPLPGARLKTLLRCEITLIVAGELTVRDQPMRTGRLVAPGANP